jgi:hypothetical protein
MGKGVRRIFFFFFFSFCIVSPCLFCLFCFVQSGMGLWLSSFILDMAAKFFSFFFFFFFFFFFSVFLLVSF